MNARCMSAALAVLLAVSLEGCAAEPGLGKDAAGGGAGGNDATGGGADGSVPGLCGSSAPVSASEVPPFHRSVAMACQPSLAASTYPGAGAACTSDDQCKPDSSGLHCLGGSCTKDECLTDDDCGAGGLCLCSEPQSNLNQCHRGNCRVDGDCGAGGYCVPSYTAGGCPAEGFYCHTPADTCIDVDTDCGGCSNEDSSGIFYPAAACHYFLENKAFGCLQLSRGGC